MSESDPLLDDLTPEQRDAVTTAADPLCIIAGAGSGKTRVLTRRIAWHSTEGSVDPRRVLALTFTRRAAAELRSRTRRLGLREEVAAGTFHAAALATLRRFWDHTGRRHPTLLTNRLSFLAKINSGLDRTVLADLDAEIGWARARLVTPEAYGEAAEAARRRPPRSAGFVAKAAVAYQEAKRERRMIDFDDVLALCHATMHRETTFAEAQRWRHRHLFVDEFQDVNPLQFAVLESLRGPDSTLVVVGDPNQAIYGWNGAEPAFLDDIGIHLPGTTVVHLRTNFRSTPEILAATGRVLDAEPQPAARMGGDRPTVTVTDPDDEPAAVARAVRARHKSGAPWRHQAILARTNAQLPAVRAALEAAGIPSRSRGEAALLRRPEIMDLLDAWSGPASLRATLADQSLEPGAGASPGAEPLDPERMAVLDSFRQLAHDHLALEPNATVDDFVSALRADDRIGTIGDAVELATFHSAKGLEWPIVHLVGLEDGIVPISFARSRAARDEEQRLLYVATTRAERELHVSYASHRTINGSLVARPPSPWLDAFRDPDADAPVSTPPVDRLRSRLGPPAPDIDLTDPDVALTPVVESLESWRAAAAHRARISPTAVLSDAALRSIAEHRPATTDELAAVPGVGPGKARRFAADLLEISAPIS